MARFITPINQVGYIDGINWRVGSVIEFESDVLGRVVIVPIGTITDFASIPRPLWGAYPPTKYAGPAAIHDKLYTEQSVTREQADRVFLEALKCIGVYSVRRYGFYWALRAAGWVAWNNHKSENESPRAAQIKL